MDEDLRTRVTAYFEGLLAAFDACQRIGVTASVGDKLYRFFGYGIHVPVKDNIKRVFRNLNTIFIENNQTNVELKLAKAFGVIDDPHYEEIKTPVAGSLVAKVQGGQTPSSPATPPAELPPSLGLKEGEH